jgi:hypothetical protein
LQFENQINDEIYKMYGLSSEDREAINSEIVLKDSINHLKNAEKKEEDVVYEKTIEDNIEQAIYWLSYAVGLVLGHFQPGLTGSLGSAIYGREDLAIGSLPLPSEADFNRLVGTSTSFAYIDQEGSRHVFSIEIERALQTLADTGGIVVIDDGHPDDLSSKIETVLDLMLGERGAAEIIYCLSGEGLPDLSQKLEFDRNSLRQFLERDFFTKWHVKLYRKRPIYWLLQSPQKRYGLYIFHERLTKDTLYLIQRKYLDVKINLTRQLLEENRLYASKQTEARARRQLDKQSDELEKLLDDLEEFARRLKAITDRGYDPDINDGVILNMAPLWQIIPSWSKEPQKYWEGLERGDYDWAHIAMKYWPERVKEKCKTDKSLAIAHGIM